MFFDGCPRQDGNMLLPRNHDKANPHGYVNPEVVLNIGIWMLYAGATVFLALRVWIKVTRRHGLWWDDWILIVTWLILTANDIIITVEYATGYVVNKWDDRMQILINVTSNGTLVGQTLSKTAFAVTLLKLTKDKKLPTYILWFCIVTMNAFMVTKFLFQWARITDKPSYEVYYRLNFHLDWDFRENYKEAGNIYNIIMDFVLAAFPWFITWNLPMRRNEKIALNLTMSLGMLVAIIAAIRTGWKDKGNVKDEWYFWRNAHSNIWYSSEIVGTIIVQCIPVLRPLLRDWSSLMTSRKEMTIDIMRDDKTLPPLPSSYGGEKSFHDNVTVNSGAKKGTFLLGDDEPDSWDNHGIYSKKEFELNSIQRKASTRAMV